MKTRTAPDIRRDLSDANRRFKELQICGSSSIADDDLVRNYPAEAVPRIIQSRIARIEQELKEATRFGEQLSLKF